MITLRPALPDYGEIEEKLRLHSHTNAQYGINNLGAR
jgi:hypothetical protein